MSFLESFLRQDFDTFFSDLEKSSDTTQFYNIFTQIPRYVNYKTNDVVFFKKLFVFLDKMNLNKVFTEVKPHDLQKFIKMLDSAHDTQSLSLIFDAMDDKKLSQYTQVFEKESVEILLNRAINTKNLNVIQEVIENLENSIIKYRLFSLVENHSFNYQSVFYNIEKNKDSSLFKDFLINYKDKTLNYINSSVDKDTLFSRIKINLFLLNEAFTHHDILKPEESAQLKVSLEKLSQVYLNYNIMKNFDYLSIYSNSTIVNQNDKALHQVNTESKVGSLYNEYKTLFSLMDKNLQPLEKTTKNNHSLLYHLLNHATLFHYDSHTDILVKGTFSATMTDALMAYMNTNKNPITTEVNESLVKLYLKNHINNRNNLHQCSFIEVLNTKLLEYLYQVGDREIYESDLKTPFNDSNKILENYIPLWSQKTIIVPPNPISQFINLVKEVFHLDTKDLSLIDEFNFAQKRKVFISKTKGLPIQKEIGELFSLNKKLAKVVENKFFEKEKNQFHHLVGQKLLDLVSHYIEERKLNKTNIKDLDNVIIKELELVKDSIHEIKKVVINLAKAKPEHNSKLKKMKL